MFILQQQNIEQIGLFEICLEAEKVPVTVQTYREKLRLLHKLSHDIVSCQLPVGPFDKVCLGCCCTWIHACICVCMCIHACICVCKRIHACRQKTKKDLFCFKETCCWNMYMNTCMCVCVCACTHVIRRQRMIKFKLCLSQYITF